MSYRVTYGTYDLYVPGSDSYALSGMKLGMRTDQVSTLAFTMPPTHPRIGTVRLHDFSRPVRVYYDETLLFCGYVTRMVTQIDMRVVVSCESDLGMLDGVHIRLSDDGIASSDQPYEPTAGQVFAWAIECYNAKVGASRQFTIGHNVGSSVGYEVSWHNGKIVDATTSTPDTALGLIVGSIVQPYGCVLKVWYEDGTRYIGLYTTAPDTNSQRIVFGENMTSFEYDLNDEEFRTACYPIGATYNDYGDVPDVATWHLTRAASVGDQAVYTDIPDDWVWGKGDLDHDKVRGGDILMIGGLPYVYWSASGSGALGIALLWSSHGEGTPMALASGTAVHYKGHSPSTDSKHTCTLYDVSNGTKETDFYKTGPIVRHTANASTYGISTFTFTDSNIGYGPDLLAKAIELLRKRSEPTLTIRVDAVDMAYYRDGYAHLQAGQRVRVVNALMGVDTTMQVTQADIDLDNPAATKYTLGAYQHSVSRKVRGNARDIGATNERVEQLRNDTVPISKIRGLV